MKEPSFSVAASTGVFAAALAALYVMLTESLILIHIVSRIRATQHKELQHIVNRDSWNRLPQEFSPKKTVASGTMIAGQVHPAAGVDHQPRMQLTLQAESKRAHAVESTKFLSLPPDFRSADALPCLSTNPATVIVVRSGNRDLAGRYSVGQEFG
ncbi:uncharacterized protein BO72DRAFT_501130 [Aspergillus fijiensis CBS 313.89]|uniref:Uncharacterized protein n=1 Tax=Aspergillus fijiensis CBS 313.89 TaxID=1448319 RepID=A0A8G1RKU1_9EURO|nr:uncharacterized protein BO72DRAFT_501130 [Aspergillus fijiensis CBS 313.89]RAK72306.1 hypothetical protein BO72DRAFT_501130 [Aspergillus fijiensis CBS 313.89]